MAKKTYTYEESTGLRNADKAFRTSVSNVVAVVQLLVYLMGLPISFLEVSIVANFIDLFGIDEISSKAELGYLLGADPEGPLHYLMFHYAEGAAFLIRGILLLAVIPWLAGVITALISAPIFRNGKLKLDLKILKYGCHWALVGVLSVVVTLLNLFRLAGLEQMNLIAGVRFFVEQDGGIFALLLCIAFFSIPPCIFFVIAQRIELLFTPFSTDRSSKMPKEPIEAYIDRVYGATPCGVRHICDQLYKDKRLIGDSNQYTALRYCMDAVRNREECRRLSDNERWSLLYEIKRHVDIIVRNMDEGNSFEDRFKDLQRNLDYGMDTIHHIPVFVSDMMTRMRKSDGDHTKREARDRDDDYFDAALKARKRSKKYGRDWTGYDPEAPGPDPEAPIDSRDIW